MRCAGCPILARSLEVAEAFDFDITDGVAPPFPRFVREGGPSGKQTPLPAVPASVRSTAIQFPPLPRRQRHSARSCSTSSPRDDWLTQGEPAPEQAYSQRSAIIGSTLEARRAGTAHANPDTTLRRIVPAKRTTGSRGFACAHFAMTWFKAKERAIPAKIPAPRLTEAARKTIRSTSARCAPSAIRIPNSLVRCATV